MVILIIEIILFLIFYLTKRHLGPSILATLAGTITNNLFNTDITNFISNLLPNIPRNYIEFTVLAFFIFLLPLSLYFKQSHSGSSTIFHIIRCFCYATVIFLILAPQLQLFLPLDKISADFLHFISPFNRFVLLTSIIFGYLDILFSQREL